VYLLKRFFIASFFTSSYFTFCFRSTLALKLFALEFALEFAFVGVEHFRATSKNIIHRIIICERSFKAVVLTGNLMLMVVFMVVFMVFR
jgi:hypothetical protein